jgi:methylphosphotriester-DNA--protein-cysteine methyltransferase
MKELTNWTPKLSDFAPKLRKLINYIIENKDFYTLDEAINQLGLNAHSISTMKSRLKKKGIILEDYICEKRNERIRQYVPYVDNSLVNRAIEGSAKHQELFYKRTGDLVNKHEVEHNIGLTFVFSSQTTPPDIAESRIQEKKEERIIDTTDEKIK